jgi:site-specific DNA-methyltransferase (adenine-specific)
MMIDLRLGDCLEILPTLEAGSVDAVITDPPFGIGFEYQEREAHNNPADYWRFLSPVYSEINRVLKDGGFCAIWQANKYLRYAWEWFGDDVRIYAGCKNFVQLRKTPINYGFDPIVIRYKQGTPLRPSKPNRNLDFFVANTAKWVAQTNSLARQHPCPRPIDQADQLVENFTAEGGVILDPFMGSGTTGAACVKMGRNFIGIEKEPRYFEIAQKRIAEAQMQTVKE